MNEGLEREGSPALLYQPLPFQGTVGSQRDRRKAIRCTASPGEALGDVCWRRKLYLVF